MIKLCKTLNPAGNLTKKGKTYCKTELVVNVLEGAIYEPEKG